MTFIYSVCIPTYNRATELQTTLNSILHQKKFGSDVEIVVVDNASSDETPDIVTQLVERYPNLRYIRNVSNLGPDANIIKAASVGRGRYIKLLNDNKTVREGVIEEWRSLFTRIDENVVFHYPGLGQMHGSTTELVLETDEFARVVSFNLTWLGGFSVKRDALIEMDPERIDRKSHLAQVDLVLRILEKSSHARVIFSEWFEEPTRPRRAGYNYFEVFTNNFPRLLNRAEACGTISRRTKQKIKQELLLNHTFPFIIGSISDPISNDLDKRHATRYLLRNFRSTPALYLFPVWALRASAQGLVRKTARPSRPM